MTARRLQRLFRAESVALIGASDQPGSVGALLSRNLLSGAYRGRAYPVNPRHAQIMGRPCYPDIGSLPEPPDLAMVAAPADTLGELIAELDRAGCGGAVVVTAPRQREPATRRALRRSVHAAAATCAMPIIGPDSHGVIVPARGLNASLAHLAPLPGDIAFLAQSGLIAGAIIDWAIPRRIGFSHLVALGDMADVDYAEVLDHLAADAGTRAILLAIESLPRARRFLSAARAASRVKPVIVIRTGRYRGGPARDAAYDAAFRRAGMLRVQTLEELFDAVEALALHGPAEARPGWGERIVVLSNGRGIGMLATDVLAGQGARLAHIGARTTQRLNEALPSQWYGPNPIDILPDADGRRYAQALDILLDDRGIDAVLVLHGPVAIADAEAAARSVAEAVERSRAKGPYQPWVFASWIGVETALPARRLLEHHRIPTFQTPSAAIHAFQYLVRHRAGLDALMQTPASISAEFDADPAAARTIVTKALAQGRRALLSDEAEALARAYRIPLACDAPGSHTVLYAAAELDGTFGPVIRLGLGGLAGRLFPRTRIGLPPLNQTLARDLIDQLLADAAPAGPDAASAPFPAEALALVLVQLSLLVCDFAEIRAIRLDPLWLGADCVGVGGVAVEVAPATAPPEARLAITPYPKHLEQIVRLESGIEALLRPIRPEDEPALRTFAERLSAEDVRMRFFQPLRSLSHDFAARLTQIDYDRQMAFVLTERGLPGAADILGVVRLARDDIDDRGGGSGEYAVTVRSDLSGRGIGRFLMARIIDYGRSIGLDAIFGLVLSENRAMLTMCLALGFRLDPVADDPSLIRATLTLR